MPTAQLIVSQPGRPARRVETSQKLISIGRKEDNVVALPGEPSVSRYHAVIRQQPDGFWLIHLSESSSTLVNDQPVQTTRRLSDGDLICLGGSSTIEFRAGGNGRTAAPAADAADDSAAPAPPDAPAPPSADAPTQPAPPPPRAAGGFPFLPVLGAVAGLAVVGLAAVLLLTLARPGADAKSDEGKVNAPPSASADAGPRPAAERDDELAEIDAVLGDAPADTPTPGAAPPTTSGGGTSPDAPPSTAGAGGTAAPEAVVQLSDKLAVQLTQRSGYRFDPAFARLIKANVAEYRAAAGFSERARKHRAAINDEFTNQGVPPLFGYVAAMSATKFRETGAGGVWGLPPEVVRASATGGGEVDMNDPAAGARVAATHLKELLDLFGREHFMYAVACYGMTLDEAGRIVSELQRKDASEQLRFDFWRMKNEGVVKGEQVDRVARFFAAGIVGENPQAFELKDKPLSSLIY